MLLYSFIVVLSWALSLALDEVVGYYNCEEPGWKCVNETNELQFDCSLTTGSVHKMYLTEISLPDDIKYLTISNCQHLKLHFMSHHAELVNLSVKKVKTLEVTSSIERQVPPEIIFEDIEDLIIIDNLTFSGKKFEHFQFSRVHINEVPIGALDKLESNKFIWDHVTVNGSLPNPFLNLKMESEGMLQITNCEFMDLEENAIILDGGNFVFENNIMDILHQNAIKAFTQDFHFVGNKIYMAKQESIHISAHQSIVKGNRFMSIEHLVFVYLKRDGYAESCVAQNQPNHVIAGNTFTSAVYMLLPSYSNPYIYCPSSYEVHDNLFLCTCQELTDTLHRTGEEDVYMKDLLKHNTCSGAGVTLDTFYRSCKQSPIIEEQTQAKSSSPIVFLKHWILACLLLYALYY